MNATEAADDAKHPALKLYHVLDGLHRVCLSAGGLRKLSIDRKQARQGHTNSLNQSGKIASHRANELARAGAPWDQQWAEFSKWLDGANRLPPPKDPDDYAKFVCNVALVPGLILCEHAQSALRDGGAKWLDAATQHNAAGLARSIELQMNLRDADRVFKVLKFNVGSPSVIIDDDVTRMAELGTWFARTRAEIGAVIETRGLDAPARTPTAAETAKAPKTRRGLSRLCQTTTKDQLIVAALREGKSYRQVARECKVGKTTVERVAKAYGLTGHPPDPVPPEGTLDENLSIRAKTGKHRGK